MVIVLYVVTLDSLVQKEGNVHKVSPSSSIPIKNAEADKATLASSIGSSGNRTTEQTILQDCNKKKMSSMLMLNKTTLGIAAGVCGTLFLGYCIYFDRKRRNDPLFKQKLRDRRSDRKRRQNVKAPQTLDLKDIDSVQRFFLQEVQLGEELLSQGDLENGVEHLSNAVAVCGQPQQLLQVLRQTLPPQVFHMLVEKLPTVSQRIVGEVSLMEDELE